MVTAKGLGTEYCPQARSIEGDRSAGKAIGGDHARMWSDGSEFRWTRENEVLPI
jgi:hypothetical protein